jgi:hypothetical protein
VTEPVADACRLLESMGFRYRKDFVIGNAIEAAGMALLVELQEEPEEGTTE